ncbi:hypothetical protein [Megamonas funiformis]|uniref:hypothetical protein n=1 Tax=Megamonas funiformis TaxID=437897 RepID=UPI003F809174
MRNKLFTIELTEDQYHLVVNCLNDVRTKCIEKDIDTTDIDELLLKIIENHEKFVSKEWSYER